MKLEMLISNQPISNQPVRYLIIPTLRKIQQVYPNGAKEGFGALELKGVALFRSLASAFGSSSLWSFSL